MFGIGLRNVNERVRLHYGSSFGLLVESTLGMGTRITLRIEDITFTTHSEDGMDYGEEMLRLLRIAIVDDEILIREGLARMISKENTEFLVIGTYSDGKHLLDELPSLQLDVVITDIRMPQINGFINWRKSSSSLVTRRYVTVPVSY